MKEIMRRGVVAVAAMRSPVFFGNLTCDGITNHSPFTGNTKYNFKYDYRNRLVEVTDDSANVVALYVYDGLNRRVSKRAYNGNDPQDTTANVWYFWAGWRAIEERDRNDSDAILRQYVYGPGYIDHHVALIDSGGDIYYYLQDRMANVTALADDTGAVVERYRYDPYGAVNVYAENGTTSRTTSSYANPYTYTGRYYDETIGLYYYRNRWYSADLGRFTTRDPAGYVDGANLYGYLAGSLDPLGLWRWANEEHTAVIAEEGDSIAKIGEDLTGDPGSYHKHFGYDVDAKVTIHPGDVITLPQAVLDNLKDEHKPKKSGREGSETTPRPGPDDPEEAEQEKEDPNKAKKDKPKPKKPKPGKPGKGGKVEGGSGSAWKKYVDTYKKTVDDNNQAEKVDRATLLAIMYAESGSEKNPGEAYRYEPEFYKRYIEGKDRWKSDPAYGDPQRISASYGAMQVMYPTAVDLGYSGRPEGLYGDASVQYGTKYFGQQIRRYNNRQDAIAAYNAGSARRNRNGEYVNQAYVDKINRFYKEIVNAGGND